MTDLIRNLDLIFEEWEEGYIVCLDQEKAVDQVNHKYLFIFMILEEIGIGGRFLRLIKAMYKNITCQLLINGKLSKQLRCRGQ